MGRDRYEAVVARPAFALFLLLGLDRADKARAYHAARDHGRFHEHEDVERVAVLAERRGDKAKIIGKDHAFRQNGRKLHTIAFGIVAVFAAAAARRLNHNPHVAVAVKGRDFGQDGMARGTGRHEKTHEINKRTTRRVVPSRVRTRLHPPACRPDPGGLVAGGGGDRSSPERIGADLHQQERCPKPPGPRGFIKRVRGLLPASHSCARWCPARSEKRVQALS